MVANQLTTALGFTFGVPIVLTNIALLLATNNPKKRDMLACTLLAGVINIIFWIDPSGSNGIHGCHARNVLINAHSILVYNIAGIATCRLVHASNSARNQIIAAEKDILSRDRVVITVCMVVHTLVYISIIAIIAATDNVDAWIAGSFASIVFLLVILIFVSRGLSRLRVALRDIETKANKILVENAYEGECEGEIVCSLKEFGELCELLIRRSRLFFGLVIAEEFANLYPVLTLFFQMESSWCALVCFRDLFIVFFVPISWAFELCFLLYYWVPLWKWRELWRKFADKFNHEITKIQSTADGKTRVLVSVHRSSISNFGAKKGVSHFSGNHSLRDRRISSSAVNISRGRDDLGKGPLHRSPENIAPQSDSTEAMSQDKPRLHRRGSYSVGMWKDMKSVDSLGPMLSRQCLGTPTIAMDTPKIMSCDKLDQKDSGDRKTPRESGERESRRLRQSRNSMEGNTIRAGASRNEHLVTSNSRSRQSIESSLD
ncbi:hypothetical protein AAMO2058_001189500 [Amorphochlora amoebiformis]